MSIWLREHLSFGHSVLRRGDWTVRRPLGTPTWQVDFCGAVVAYGFRTESDAVAYVDRVQRERLT